MFCVSFRGDQGVGKKYKKKTMVPPPISHPAHLAASLQLGLRQQSLRRNQQNNTVRYNLHLSAWQGPNTHTPNLVAKQLSPFPFPLPNFSSLMPAGACSTPGQAVQEAGRVVHNNEQQQAFLIFYL